jgi:hypothetical protein
MPGALDQAHGGPANAHPSPRGRLDGLVDARDQRIIEPFVLKDPASRCLPSLQTRTQLPL